MQALRILREADADIRIREGVTRWCKGGAGSDADTRVAHQIGGESETVAHAVHLQKSVECALRRNPADTVLLLHKTPRHVVALAAALQQKGAKFIAPRRQCRDPAPLREGR